MPARDEPENVLRAFGEAVRKRRKELGISQEELAFRASLNRSYIADIERGTRNVALTNIAKLAGALGLEIHELLSPLGRSRDAS
jgi:transcriptional regulator with XRE-family HTH domain